jgi:hypothetical protein
MEQNSVKTNPNAVKNEVSYPVLIISMSPTDSIHGHFTNAR